MDDPRAEIEARIYSLNMLRSHAFELIQAERGLRAADPNNRLLQLMDANNVGPSALECLDLWTRELTEALQQAADLPLSVGTIDCGSVTVYGAKP